MLPDNEKTRHRLRENIANHISNKGLSERIYKALLKLNRKQSDLF